MLRYRETIGSAIPATLLYSSRSWDEIIFREELERLSTDPAVRVIHTLTRSHPDEWNGYTRRIDAAMLEDVAGSPEQGRLAYVCGPTQLVENVASALVSIGYPPARVKTERFGPTGG
jgi:ferredoxin-NADP reductase